MAGRIDLGDSGNAPVGSEAAAVTPAYSQYFAPLCCGFYDMMLAPGRIIYYYLFGRLQSGRQARVAVIDARSLGLCSIRRRRNDVAISADMDLGPESGLKNKMGGLVSLIDT